MDVKKLSTFVMDIKKLSTFFTTLPEKNNAKCLKAVEKKILQMTPLLCACAVVITLNTEKL